MSIKGKDTGSDLKEFSFSSFVTQSRGVETFLIQHTTNIPKLQNEQKASNK